MSSYFCSLKLLCICITRCPGSHVLTSEPLQTGHMQEPRRGRAVVRKSLPDRSDEPRSRYDRVIGDRKFEYGWKDYMMCGKTVGVDLWKPEDEKFQKQRHACFGVVMVDPRGTGRNMHLQVDKRISPRSHSLPPTINSCISMFERQ